MSTNEGQSKGGQESSEKQILNKTHIVRLAQILASDEEFRKASDYLSNESMIGTGLVFGSGVKPELLDTIALNGLRNTTEEFPQYPDQKAIDMRRTAINLSIFLISMSYLLNIPQDQIENYEDEFGSGANIFITGLKDTMNELELVEDAKSTRATISEDMFNKMLIGEIGVIPLGSEVRSYVTFVHIAEAIDALYPHDKNFAAYFKVIAKAIINDLDQNPNAYVTPLNGPQAPSPVRVDKAGDFVMGHPSQLGKELNIRRRRKDRN
jgi:hypothetical protein